MLAKSMPLFEKDRLVQPIIGTNPSGEYLRNDLVYQDLQEARRQDDVAPMGEWERPLKKADWHTVYTIATDALANRTKDLQIAAWLTEALCHLEGWIGLQHGLELIAALVDRFWDTVHPPLDSDGDA